MLQNKDIKNLSELKSSFVQANKKEEFFSELIDVLKIGKYHSTFSKSKQKGIAVLAILRIIISFPFLGLENVHQFTNSSWSKLSGFGKDAYYRLMNNPRVNWRGFLFGVVKSVIQNLSNRELQSASNQSVSAIVFDDTPIEKTGRRIEGVSKIWNHVINKSVLGYQLLVMGIYDGVSFMPVDFSFHREQIDNKKFKYGLKPKHYKQQFRARRDSCSAGYKRKNELNITKISSAANMIARAAKNGITAQYVLADSWFTCWQIVRESLKANMNFVGMFSKVTTLFEYDSKHMTYSQIRQKNRRNTKRCKRFNLYYIRTVADWNGQKVVLYFTRKGKHGKWKTILSTDLSASFVRTVEIYQIRWTIEVFFKETKQLLGLGKCQSNNFDAQIASTTLVMVQYIFLALRNRVHRYESIGGIFRYTRENITEQRLHERLIAVLIAIVDVLETIFDQLDADDLIVKFLRDEQTYNKLKPLIFQHESKVTLEV
jgi:hypothetical protein